MREFSEVVDSIRGALEEKDPAWETLRSGAMGQAAVVGAQVPPLYQAHTILDGYEYVILVVPTAQAGGILTGAEAAGAERVVAPDKAGTDAEGTD